MTPAEPAFRDAQQIRDAVRASYGRVAEKDGKGGCCAPAGAPTAEKKSARIGYSSEEMNAVPEDANLGLGCGNPQAIAAMKPGETDLLLKRA
jgi:hypothetical protein